jgi:hypothetical protein
MSQIQTKETIQRKNTQVSSAIGTVLGASSSSSLLSGWWYLRHSLRSSWFCSTRLLMECTSNCIAVMDCCMVLMPPWMAAKASIIWEKLIFGSEGGTVWEDEAMSRKPTSMAAGMGTSSSESSLRSFAFDYIKVCLLMGCWIFIFGYPIMLMPDWRMIWVSRQPKGRLVLPSSRASSITLIICLHRQKGKRRWMA